MGNVFSVSAGAPEYATVPTFPIGSPHAAKGDLMWTLTTPVRYLESLPYDPFSPAFPKQPFAYYSPGGPGWMLVSAGPDRDFDFDPTAYVSRDSAATIASRILPYKWDPTNGSRSSGDIILVTARGWPTATPPTDPAWDGPRRAAGWTITASRPGRPPHSYWSPPSPAPATPSTWEWLKEKLGF